MVTNIPILKDWRLSVLRRPNCSTC